MQLVESQGNLFGTAAHVLIQFFSGFDDRLHICVNKSCCILPLLQSCRVNAVHRRIGQQIVSPDGCIHAGIPYSLGKLSGFFNDLINCVIDALDAIRKSRPAQFGSDRGQGAVQTGSHAIHIAQFGFCCVGISSDPLHGLAQLVVFPAG